MMMKLLTSINKPEIAFLILSLFFGLLYLIFSPPLHEMDGPNHFKRAYQISIGQFLPERVEESVGGYLPTPFIEFERVLTSGIISERESKLTYSTFLSLMKTGFSRDELVFHDFRNTALYSPIAYLPQSIGLMTARITSSSVLSGIMFGRILNFLFWLTVIYYAIKITPIFKWVLVLYAVMPISIFLSTSLSADVITISLSFFVIALMLNLILNKESKIDRKTVVLVIVTALLLSIAKQGYSLVLLLCLLIPKDKFSSRTKQIYFCLAILGSALLTTALWAILIKDYYEPIAVNVDPGQQLNFLKDRVYWYIVLLRDNFLLWYLGEYNKHLFSYNLGWHDIVLPAWMTGTYPLALLFIFLNEDKTKYRFSVAKKLIVFLIFLLIYAVIATSIYVSSNGVGAVIIFLQGRYFLPFTILLPISLYSTLFQVERKVKMHKIVLSYCSVILAVALYTIIQTYYY